MHRSSESVAALATALAKAQVELVNPEKSLVATLPTDRHGEPGQSFRYAPLSSGLEIVRKTLGRHEIAVMQTTAIDQVSRTVQLTTLLAHKSGEWISSDWPVCPVTDTNAPRRMGAALTYARRYALFALVGIAGEDDVDAPDLNGGTHPGQVPELEAKATSAGIVVPVDGAGEGNRPLSRRNGKASAVPGRPMLDPQQSAGLRDLLLTEIVALGSADEAASWARRGLEAKNRLTTTDAALVEQAFETRIASFERSKKGEGSPRASAPAEVNGTTPPDSEEPKGVDKSALTFGEPRRHRSKTHLAYVSSLSCLACGRRPSDAHHLRFAQPRTLGRKVGDQYTVPLCRTHHREIHGSGDEKGWWKNAGIDPVEVARRLWGETLGASTSSNRRGKRHAASDAGGHNGQQTGAA